MSTGSLRLDHRRLPRAARSPAPSSAAGPRAAACRTSSSAILGAIVGGWLAQQLGFSQAQGFIAAVVVAVLGAIVVRVILEALSPNSSADRRPCRDASDGPDYHRAMTDTPTPSRVDRAARRRRPYSPGLEGVIAGETALSKVDGERGRLLYRGYRIGDLVEHGTYPAVANLLWTGDWDPSASPADRARPGRGPDRPARAAARRQADGRAADRGLGLGRDAGPALAADRRAGPRADRVLAVGARRVRPAARGQGADRARSVARPRRGLPVPAQGRATRPRRPRGRSTPTSSSAPSTASTPRRSPPGSSPRPESDLASAVAGAIGTMKGPLHGGAPSEVVDQLAKVGSAEHAEEWLRDALDRGERLMGFGHRVYRAYDPRAAALRKVAEGMEHKPDWLAARDRRSRTSRCGSSPRSTRSGRSRRTSSSTRRRSCMGVGPSPGPVPGDVLARPPRRLDRPRPRAGRRTTGSSGRTSATSAPRSATCRPDRGLGHGRHRVRA